MRLLLSVIALFAFSWQSSVAQPVQGVPTDSYTLEKTHAYLIFSVKHAGLSDYIVNFTDVDVNLDFNAQSPELSEVHAIINLTALNTNLPDPTKKVDWENELLYDSKYFNAREYKEIRFKSTSVKRTGERTGVVTGDLHFLGSKKSMQLDVEFNGSGKSRRFGDRTLIGFNARGTIKRSDFGMTVLIPFISDEVGIEFSGELVQVQ